MNNPKQEPSGIGGWLLVFIIQLAIASVSAFGHLENLVYKIQAQHPELLHIDKWIHYRRTMELIAVFGFVLCWYAGIFLICKKKWFSIEQTIAILWIVWPISDIAMFMARASSFGEDFFTTHTVGYTLGSVVAAAIWTAYLLKSVRVRNTYGGAQAQQNDNDVHASKIISVENLNEPTLLDSIKKNEPQPVKEPHSKMIEPSSNEQTDSSNSQERIISEVKDTSNLEQKISALENAEFPVARPLDISDDKIYEKALEEIESNKPHKASWARAFSETEGDEVKTKALYIKLRVANIKDKLRQEEKKRQAEARRIQDLQEQEDRRLKAVKEAENEKLERANGKAQMFDELGTKWSTIVRKNENVLAGNNLEDYLYDIARVRLDDRKNYAQWIRGKSEKWIKKTLNMNPASQSIGHYGIILLVALEKGIDIQGAKKWGRPSRFKVLKES